MNTGTYDNTAFIEMDCCAFSAQCADPLNVDLNLAYCLTTDDGIIATFADKKDAITAAKRHGDCLLEFTKPYLDLVLTISKYGQRVH